VASRCSSCRRGHDLGIEMGWRNENASCRDLPWPEHLTEYRTHSTSSWLGKYHSSGIGLDTTVTNPRFGEFRGTPHRSLINPTSLPKA
jgi:hypothetical protein